MNPLLAALTPVAELFERVGIQYHVGGSVASSTMGLMRTTLDVDVVADIRIEHCEAISDGLAGAYYVDEKMIRDAVLRVGSFNLIHLPTMYKIDIFVLKPRSFDQSAFHRSHFDSLPDSSRLFPFASAEDVVLNKLEWYRLGGEVSSRQWSDVLGVLRVQAAVIDHTYLRHWAGELGIVDLLERAVLESRS